MFKISDDPAPECIMWNACPVVYPKSDDGVLVELQWGWTAGMSKEELIHYAEDSPQGYSSILMNLEQVKELRNNLNKIIEKFG